MSNLVRPMVRTLDRPLVRYLDVGNWWPRDLFVQNEAGAWYDPSDLSTLFQDSAGTTAVTGPGDPVGRMEDKSGNGNHATQSTDAARPVYRDSDKRIDLDETDDNMAVDFGSAFTGTVIQGTPNGTLHMEIDVSDGQWSLTQDPAYVPDGGDTIGLVAVEGTPTSSKINKTKSYLQNKGAGVDFAGVTSMREWFRGRSDITAIYSGSWDTSQVTDFGLFADGCSSLTTVTVNGGTGNPFGGSTPCTDYTSAFTNTNLDQTSIDNILTQIDAAGTSNGTFDQSGGSAPSSTGETAIDNLRSRGWTVSVTGGY